MMTLISAPFVRSFQSTFGMAERQSSNFVDFGVGRFHFQRRRAAFGFDASLFHFRHSYADVELWYSVDALRL
jgi:hypothetical protein